MFGGLRAHGICTQGPCSLHQQYVLRANIATQTQKAICPRRYLGTRTAHIRMPSVHYLSRNARLLYVVVELGVCVCVLFPLFPPLAAGLRWRQPPCLLLHAGRPTPFAVLAVRARRQAWTCAVGFVGSPVDVVAHGPQPARVANWTHVDSGRHVIAGAEANDWPWMEWATELSPQQRDLLHGGTVTACGVSARPIFGKPVTTGPVRDAQCTITLALTGEVARTVYAHPARMTRRTSLAKHPTRIA